MLPSDPLALSAEPERFAPDGTHTHENREAFGIGSPSLTRIVKQKIDAKLQKIFLAYSRKVFSVYDMHV